MSEDNNDLEDFRKQWREEVLRKRATPGQQGSSELQASSSKNPPAGSVWSDRGFLALEPRLQVYDDDSSSKAYNFDDLEEREEARKLGTSGTDVHPESRRSKEPVSALEHYEEAVEREREGKLGESLKFYRKAYRLDDCVDQAYKKKHFPPSFPKPKTTDAKPPPLPTLAAPSSSQFASGPTLSDLVTSFANAQIVPNPPIIPGDTVPPCPIASLPNEILSEIIDCVAFTDVAILPGLALVSKRFAYLIASYEGLWKRLVHGTKYGLAGMHHSFAVTLDWFPVLLDESELLSSQLSSLTLSQTTPPPLFLPLSPTFPSYHSMFRLRPRIRFNGLYIATANYTRPGAASTNTITWSSPVHIVTYYRYLRFYRDGTCISLLTTTEPADVVPFFSRETLERKDERERGDKAGALAASGNASVIRDMRKGRWKLSALDLPLPTSLPSPSPSASEDLPQAAPDTDTDTPVPPPPSEPIEPEGNLTLETEGPTKTYTHVLHLSLRSTGSASGGPGGGAAANTKLAWRSFWSHNRLTDDWAEFGLRNDRAYWWSRVRSWGDA